jgi:hypothetical protein
MLLGIGTTCTLLTNETNGELWKKTRLVSQPPSPQKRRARGVLRRLDSLQEFATVWIRVSELRQMIVIHYQTGAVRCEGLLCDGWEVECGITTELEIGQKLRYLSRVAIKFFKSRSSDVSFFTMTLSLLRKGQNLWSARNNGLIARHLCILFCS